MSGVGPLAAARTLAGRQGRAVLHGGAPTGTRQRFSFVACEPDLEVMCWSGRVLVRDRHGDALRDGPGDLLAELADRIAEREAAVQSDPHPVPLAIGYLGYGLGANLVGLRARHGPASGLPDAWFGLYGAVARFDHQSGERRIVGPDPAAGRRLAQLLDGTAEPPDAPVVGELSGDRGADRAYRAGFERAREYIAAGDIYQVNLSRRLVAPVIAPGDSLAILESIDRSAPAAYSALIDCQGGSVVSASPEQFLHRAPGSQRLETRPIKGTRRRAGHRARNRQLAVELRSDPKECAEHLMIVDLERNDLGRLAELGSVRVDEFQSVVELPTLLHMVSTVSCRLRPEVGLADILRATFPGGSITGAPKIRAMQIIDELEPVGRGVYTGALGYVGAGGAIDLCIAIRTAEIGGGQVSLGVGGAVVADSSLARELEETEEKAAAWRLVLAPMTCSRAGRARGAPRRHSG